MTDKMTYGKTITELCEAAHTNAEDKGFWDNPLSPGEAIALMHSELSEALEAARNPDKQDDHLPHLDPMGVELADCCIRIFDFCGAYGIDLERCISEKMAYNRSRPRKHGKAF